MKELSIADLIALEKYCWSKIASNKIMASQEMDYWYDFAKSCEEELKLRLDVIHKPLESWGNYSIS